ncbi:MAG: hypothetical protein INH43_25825 [Acidobacteriaceae bacterium]|jgi:hypothetical protein|nr:hypothetical protein [Acidobacteriaceae bacterium]
MQEGIAAQLPMEHPPTHYPVRAVKGGVLQPRPNPAALAPKAARWLNLTPLSTLLRPFMGVRPRCGGLAQPRWGVICVPLPRVYARLRLLPPSLFQVQKSVQEAII